MTKTVRSLKVLEDPFNYHYPAGATIVTSHANGRNNAMAVAWHTAISRNPALYAISISDKRFTHELIMESGEFVVNFMPQEMGDLVAMVAGCSGREVDKFRAFEIESSPGSEVEAAVLTRALASYECKVMGRHPYGDHDIFVGEIVAVQYEPSAFGERGRLDLERVKPILYVGGDWYSTAEANSFYLDRAALIERAKEGSPTPRS